MGELLYYDEEEEWNRALLLYDAVLKEISTKLEILTTNLNWHTNTTQSSI